MHEARNDVTPLLSVMLAGGAMLPRAGLLPAKPKCQMGAANLGDGA